MVEDDASSSKALRSLFTRRGWIVVVAATIHEALAILGSEFDCLVLDLMLPDGDGVQILEQIRARHLPIRVAVTTGISDLTRLQAVADLKPEAFLRKPISFQDLLTGFGAAP